MNDQAPDFDDTTIQRAKRFDGMCDEFETQCLAGNRPRIESFLLRVDGPDKQPLLVELIAIEMHYRQQNGESIAFAEYQTRFPGLSVSRLEETIQHSEKVHSPKTPAADQPTIDSRQSQVAHGESKLVKYFGDYELLDVIARGGMGVVYKARQVSLNRIVALKMILSGEFASKEEVDRFYSEAKAAALLDHPGIVPIYEVGEYEGKHFFSMTYVEGSSLAAKLNDGPLEPIQAAKTILEVSQALHYAHEQGVIHRDLKPSNILLDMHGRPRVTDFGLAKRLTEDTGMTVSGQVLGTPSYMPPEQAAGHINTIGPASDVYALGAVLYSLTTGRPPFQSASSIDTLRQVVEKEPVAPRQLNPAIPRDLETIILKCLEKSLPRRYGSANLLSEELKRFVEGRPIVARPIGRVAKVWRWCRRQPVIAMLLAAVLLSLLSGVGVSSYFALIAQAKANSEAIARKNETYEREEAQKQAQLARKQAEVASTQTAIAEEARIAEARQTQIAKDKSSELRRSLYLSDMKQLATLKSEGKIPRIRELLQRQIPDATEEEDLRSFDWNYWHRQVNPPTVVFDLKQPIEVMVASSDERLVALGCTGGKAYIFDVSAGKLLDEVYEIIESHWSSIAFSDSDRRLFGFGKTGTFSLWDRDSKSLVESNNYTDTWIRTGVANVTTFSPRIPAAVSPDGRWMLAGDPVSQYSNGQCLALWQTQKFTVSAVPMLNDGEQISVSIGQNGDLSRRRYEFDQRIPGDLLSQHFYCFPKNFQHGLYPVSQEIEEMGKFVSKEYEPCQIVDQDALRRNYESSLYVRGAAINPPQDQWGSPVFGVHFSPDSSRLAAAKRDGKILLSSMSEIIDPQQWTRLTSKEISAHRGTARQLSYSPNGNLLLSVGDDGRWVVINSTTGEEISSGGRGVKPLWYCHWLTNKQFMVGTQDGNFEVWDLHTKSPLRSISFEPEAMSAQAILRRKGLAIFGGKLGKIHLWELKGEADYILPTDNWSTFDIAISKSGQYLAAKSTDDHWYLGDCHSSPMYLEHFSAYHEPDGVYFPSSGGMGYSIIDNRGQKDRSTVPDANIQGPRAFFSPMREELLQLTSEGIHVWQMEPRQLLKKWSNLGNVDSIQLNLGGYNWDESTRTLSPTPFLVKEKQSFVKYADLSPDGLRFILFSITSSKQRVRASVFDLELGTNTHCIELNGDGVNDEMVCRFVSNSKAVISAKGTKAPVIAVWDLESNLLTAASKQLVKDLKLNADTQALAVSPSGNSFCVWGTNASGASFWRIVDSSNMEIREQVVDGKYQCIRAFVGSDQSLVAILRNTEHEESGRTLPLVWASLDRQSSKWVQACVLENSKNIGRVYQTQWDEQNGRVYLFDNAHRGCIRCRDLSNGTEANSTPIKLETVDCVGIKNNGEEIAFVATRANAPSTGERFKALQTRVRGQFSNVDLPFFLGRAISFLTHFPDLDGWLSSFGFSTKQSTTNDRDPYETWVREIQSGKTVVSRDCSTIAQADPLGRVSIWKKLVSSDRVPKPSYAKIQWLNDISKCTTQPFIAISDTGDCLVVAAGAMIACRNVASDEWQHTPLPSSVSSLSWSRNSQKVAIGFADGSVGMFDVDQNQFKPFGTAHRGSVTNITWMPDGKTFASGGDDGAIEIWDAQQRETRIRIQAHRGKVNSLQMSDDGSLLVSGGEDGFVRLHRASLPSNEISSSTELSMPTSEPVSKPVDLTPEQHRTVAAIEWLQDAKLNIQTGFGAFGTSLRLDQVALYEPRQLNIQSIKIQEKSTVTDNELDRFPTLSMLKEFVLTKKTMTANGLAKLSGLVKLERLDLSGIRLDGFDLLSLGISKSLVQLRLGSTGVTDQQLQSVIANCPKLVELDLFDTAISNSGVEAVSQLAELSVLRLRGTKIDDGCIDAIGRLSNLSVLDVSSTQMKASTIISRLGELDQLSTLQMTNLGCMDLDLEPLVSTRVEPSKGKWTRLRHLDLRNNPVSLDAIFKIYSSRKGLFSPVVQATVSPNEPEDLATLFEIGGWWGDTMLRIGQNEMRFSDILEPLRNGEHVTALTWPRRRPSLPINYWTGFDASKNERDASKNERKTFFLDPTSVRPYNDDDVNKTEMLRRFTQLTELRMDWLNTRFELYLPQLERLPQISVLVIDKWRSESFTIFGTRPGQEIPFGLLRKSANIKKLILRPGNGLTPKEIKELASLPQLEFLDFDIIKNPRHTLAFITQLADAIPELRGLRIHNEWITNKELADAVSRFQRLEKLELVGAKLTIMCGQSLSKLSSLKELTLIRCGLGSKDLSTISSALPGCRVTIDDQMAFLRKIGNLAPLSEANTSPATANTVVEKHRLAGTVSLPNGGPASNATVTLLQFAQGVRTNHKVATTDAIGTYVFDGVETGKYTLWAEWNELTSLEERRLGPTLELSQTQDAKKSFDLSLHEGCRYAITVLDKSTRQPIANAKITYIEGGINRNCSTNQNGFVEIAGLASNEWLFAFKSETYAHSIRTQPRQPLGSRTDVVIELEPGSTLTGAIRDKEGKGVQKAKVSTWEILANGGSRRLDRTETDQEGKFELNLVPWGTEFKLQVDSENFVRLDQRLTIPLDVKSLNVDLSLTRAVYGGDCIVYVVNESGSPIAGASIENKGSLDARKGETDERGMLRLDNLLTGSRGKNAIVKAAGYIAQQVPLVAGKKEMPGEVTVKLVKGQSIRGRLLKPNGEPAAFVGVMYSQKDLYFGRDLGGRVHTDSNGRFQIEDLPSPSLFAFFSPKPFAPIANRPLPVGSNNEVVVTLEKEGVIRIRAMDDVTNRTIPEFNVKVGFTTDRRPNDPQSTSLPGNVMNPGILIGDDLKEFRLGQLTPGMPVQITVTAKGYFKKVFRRVEATLESESDVIDVELTPEDDNMFRTVSGSLVDSSGKPVAGASVRLLVFADAVVHPIMPLRLWNRIETPLTQEDPGCLQYLKTTTEQDGSFRLERVQIGHWMELFHFGGNAANGRKLLDDRESLASFESLVIEAPLAGSIKVIVDLEKFPNAYSVTIASFDVYAAVGQTTKQLGVEQKSVVFDQLPPGLYKVSLQEKKGAAKNGLIPSQSDPSEKADVVEKEEEIVEFK